MVRKRRGEGVFKRGCYVVIRAKLSNINSVTKLCMFGGNSDRKFVINGNYKTKQIKPKQTQTKQNPTSKELMIRKPIMPLDE